MLKQLSNLGIHQMLNQRIVLVTGGAGRLGSEFCKGIIENKGKVIIGDISEERGKALEKELNKDNSIFVKVDTSNTDSIKNLIEQGKNHYGRIENPWNWFKRINWKNFY